MWSSVGAQFTEYNYTLLDIATTAPIPNDYVFSQDEFTEDRLAAISEKDGEAALDVNVNIRGFNLRPPKVEGASANNAEEEEKESLIKKNRERKEEDEDDEVLEMESVLDYNSGDSSSLLNYPPMFFYQDQMGMTITSGIVTIKKDATNLIGISIGGGAPLCPCLYIVQVFDNTPAAKEGTLESGDELVGVNGASVKGKTKVEVAKMIQACKDEVQIKYNKLHADPQQGKTLDIVLKKAKHRLVENMSAATADALGLSRAILCNDTLVKKLEELEEKEVMYRGLVDHTKRVMKATLNLLYVYKAFGDAFAEIGVREPQPRASEAFRQFGDYHRQMEKSGIKHLRAMKPILADLGTYLNKAIPDTKLTIKKYADTKFEYLSYCLKVKEKDDEEYGYAALQEPLYRVETGNYEYRLLLRCRQEARARFARLRSDVLVKLELLDNKHVQHVVWQLQKLVAGLVAFHQDAHELIKSNSLFPIEMDLTQTAFQYSTTQTVAQYEDEDDELLQPAEEVREDTVESSVALDIVDLLNSKELNGTEQLVATDDNLISTDPATSHFTNIDLGQGLLIPDLNATDAASLTTDFADFSLNSPSPVDLKPSNLDLQNLDDNDIPTGKLIGIE